MVMDKQNNLKKILFDPICVGKWYRTWNGDDQDAEVGDRQPQQVDIHDPFEFWPREDDEVKKVSDNAHRHNEEGDIIVGDMIYQTNCPLDVTFLYIIILRWKIQSSFRI